MKRSALISILLLPLFLAGCGILAPKNVELFQSKVKAVPEFKASERETQRETAALAHEKAQETLVAAVAEGSSEAITAPASDAVSLTKSVSVSLGPPLSPTILPAEAQAKKLDSAVASLNKRLDDFKQRNNEFAGKKIEGTGVFQIGYFSMWLWIIIALAVIWGALKIYGLVNPVVGIGVNTVGRVTSTVLKKGVSEIVQGGEWFKEYLSEQKSDLLSKREVLDLFQRAQVEAQSRDVQTLVENLTRE